MLSEERMDCFVASLLAMTPRYNSAFSRRKPRWVMATTPRPSKLLKEILARDDVVVTRGSTFDNADNLAPPFLEAIRRKYEGTRLGRQELHAELLSDTPGALWQQDWLDRDRVKTLPWDGLQRIVIAIDPAVTSGEDAG